MFRRLILNLVFLLLFVSDSFAAPVYVEGTHLQLNFTDLRYLQKVSGNTWVGTQFFLHGQRHPNGAGYDQVIVPGPSSYRIDFYEDITDTSPFYNNVRSEPHTLAGWGFDFNKYGNLVWGDHEGRIEISVLDGQMNIGGVEIVVQYEGGFQWGRQYDNLTVVSPVPISGSILFLSTGLFVVVGRKRKFSNPN